MIYSSVVIDTFTLVNTAKQFTRV